MQYVETTIGGAKVLIEDVSAKDRRGMRDAEGGPLQPRRVEDLIDRMKPVIAGLASVGEGALSSLPSRPDEVSLTVSMGYDAELDAWLLKGDASLTFDVEVTWKKDAEKGERA